MPVKISIRPQLVKDAKRFYEILNDQNFIYFNPPPKTIKEEREFLRKNPERRRKNIEWNFSIVYRNKVIGAVGIKMKNKKKGIGEIGYFVDSKYWGKGIAVQAVLLAEKIAIKDLKLKTIQIIMNTKNKASEKVAKKSGHKKKKLIKNQMRELNGEKRDAYLYTKNIYKNS